MCTGSTLPPHSQHLIKQPEKKLPPDFPDKKDAKPSGDGFPAPSFPQRSTPRATDHHDYPPIESRKVEPGEPASRVNTLAYEIEELHREYRSVHAQRESLLAQHDLAISLPTIRHLLDNEEEALDCTAFTILYVSPDGKMTSVIPPDNQLKAVPKKANDLKNRLLQQVDKVEQNFTPTRMAELKQDIRTTSRSLSRIQTDLNALKAPLPIINNKERLTWLDLLPGQTPPLTGTGKPFSGPERHFQFETLHPADIPRARLRADAALRPSLHFRPSWPEESDENLPPPPPMTPLPEKPEMKHVEVGTDEEVAVLPLGDDLTDPDFLPEVVLVSATEDLENPDIFYSLRQSPGPYPMASVHAGGSDLRIGLGEGTRQAFREQLKSLGADKFKNFHRRVLKNAEEREDARREWLVTPEELGDPEFGAPDGVSLCYIKKGRIKNRNKHAGTVFIHVFNPRNRTSHPGNKTENMAMIHVVLPDGKHRQYLGNKRGHLLDLESTYYDLTLALQAYNLRIRRHNQKQLDDYEKKKKKLPESSKPDLLPEIPTLRVCDFHKEAYRHPEASREEEAHCIFKGIQRACVEIQLQKDEPLTLRRLELGDGTQQTFASLGIQNKPEGPTQPSEKPVRPPYVPEPGAPGEAEIPEPSPVIQSVPVEDTEALPDTHSVNTLPSHYKPVLNYICLENGAAQQLLSTNTDFAKSSQKTDKPQQPGQSPVAQKTGVECKFKKEMKVSSGNETIPIQLSGCFDNEEMRKWAELRLKYHIDHFLKYIEKPTPIQLPSENLELNDLREINQQYDGAIVNALNHLYIDLGHTDWKNSNSSITVTINGNIWVANRGNMQIFRTDCAVLETTETAKVVNIGADNTALAVQEAMKKALEHSNLHESEVAQFVEVLPAITKIPAFDLDRLADDNESEQDLEDLLEYDSALLIQMGEATGQQFSKQDVATLVLRAAVHSQGEFDNKAGFINRTDLNGKPFDQHDVFVSLIDNPFEPSEDDDDDENEPTASGTSSPVTTVAPTLQELATTVASENQQERTVLSEDQRVTFSNPTNKHHSPEMDALEHRLELDENTVQKKLKQELAAANKQQSHLLKGNIQQPFKDAEDHAEHIEDSGEAEAVPFCLDDQEHVKVHYDTTNLSGTGYAESIGKRESMEDAHISEVFTVRMGSSEVKVSITGVFDGHGGRECATYASQHIIEHLKRRLAQFNTQGATDTGIWNALKIALVDLNREMAAAGIQSGSTANIAVRINDDLWIANLGDSRAIMVNADGTIIQVSEDAEPSDSRYKKSVEKRGGFVSSKFYDGARNKVVDEGVFRVWQGGENGVGLGTGVAMPRALGDFAIPGLSARPKITKIPINDFTGCLVQTCDGIPEVATTNDIGEIANTSYLKGDPPHFTAAKLVSRAYYAGSLDNLSAVVTHLGERKKTGGQPQRKNVELPPKAPFQPKPSSDLPPPPRQEDLPSSPFSTENSVDIDDPHYPLPPRQFSHTVHVKNGSP